MDTAALQRWAARTEREVTLPSGQRAKIVIPAPEALLRNDAMPQDLRAMVLQFTTGAVNPNELDADGMATFLRMQQELASLTLRRLWVEDEDDASTGKWVDARYSVDQLQALDLPQDDMTSLENLALRRVTPAQLTAASLAELGMLDVAMAAQVQRQEAAGTIGAYGTFRDEPRGAGAGANGAAVREPAVNADGDPGSSPSLGH